MNELSESRIKELLEVAYETRYLEFKSPFSWNDGASRWLKEKTTRAILGLTNTRSGGTIVVGVAEENKRLIMTGMTDAELRTFEDYDGIKGYVDGFADDHTDFDIYMGPYGEKKFVVIEVQEFFEMPVICKKDGAEDGVLRRDDIYVRSRKAPYSTRRARHFELREIIKMAADKERIDLSERGYQKPGAQEFYRREIEDLDA